jgi:hypothetical protein
MWRLKDEAMGAVKLENAMAMKKRLEALAAHIDEITSIEVGINFNKSAAAYDVALYSEFVGTAELKAYQEHPEHKKVADFIHAVVEERAVVDYKL